MPGKNIKLLSGKPLIQYTIDAAREIFQDNLILVSTDDSNIKLSVESLGLTVPFIRPSELATDEASTQDVLLHALKFSEESGYFPDVIILLQPTSPFRKSKHIQEALNLYKPVLDMVVSVKETASNPYFVLFEENQSGYLVKSKNGNFLRRQDCPKVWEYNGAIYVINVSSLRSKAINNFEKVVKYEMSEMDSVDIDNEFDWMLCETIMKSFNQ